MKHLVRQPRMSEKSLDLAGRGWYTFVVDKHARKEEIAKAIGALYAVVVTDVRTVAVHGKERRVGRMRKSVKKSDWKKALVKLAPGQRIDAFEVTTEEKKVK